MTAGTPKANNAAAVASDPIAFVNSAGGDYAEGGTRTVTLPASMAENDLCLIAITKDQSLVEVETIPSGWTERFVVSESNDVLLQLLYKVQGATPDTTVDIAFPAGTGDFGVLTAAYRNVDPTTPFDVADTHDTGGSGNPDSPSITPANDNCMILSLGALDDDVIFAAPTPPSGFTLAGWADANEGSEGNATLMLAHLLQETAGAINPGAWDSFGGDLWRAASLALRQAT